MIGEARFREVTFLVFSGEVRKKWIEIGRDLPVFADRDRDDDRGLTAVRSEI